jgi:hypothetical protein
MTDIELALIKYDGDGSKPYCDVVYNALKKQQLADNEVYEDDEEETDVTLNLDEVKEIEENITEIYRMLRDIQDIMGIDVNPW